LSEETKLAYIQERLREAKRHQRYGTFLTILGFIFIILFLFSVFRIWYLGSLNILVLLLGLGVFAWGLFENVRNDLKHRVLLDQLGRKTFATTCPKCGKDVPNVNFAFCPFCGVELERK
jgi:uncharacterized membrane protein